MKKLCITGSSGFIGGELVKHFAGKFSIVKYDLKNGQDILDYKRLKQSIRGCDIVIHCAALRKPYQDKTFADYFQINCLGTFNIAQAAVETGVKRLIFTSSTSYYGAEKGIPHLRPIRESNPVLTQHVQLKDLHCRDCDIAYSTSKVIAEQILANYGLTKKIEIIILRLGPTRKQGEYRPFLGLHLTIENALQALELAATSKKKLWYEALTITDNVKDVNLSKAKRLLGYNPR
ncbi:NAD(P)-dependent oxidoreductase [Patescibacteria group bacterium]|nr:NAD(P)-dependent oxidoreductase [Patescibacteria group bacterium]